VANRKERRAAKKTSPLRRYEVMIAKEISDGWADQKTLSPDAINDLLGMLYEKHPTYSHSRWINLRA
jgi:hypothetical protein